MEFQYGADVPRDVRVVALLWQSMPLGDAPEHNCFDLLPSEPGVYAIEGHHDAYPGRSVLYVGQAGEGDVNSSLRDRVPTSMQARFLWREKKGPLRLYSNVWGLTVRWAKVRAEIVRDIEAVLIAAHVPAFNSQLVGKAVSEARADLLVLNGGAKGHLVPVAFGGYFRSEFFPSY